MTISLKAGASGTFGTIQVNGVDKVTVKDSGVVDVPKGIGGTPAFSAYPTADQGVATNGWVQVICASNEYLHGVTYTSGNNRFTPQVAGYYYFTLSLDFNCTAGNLAAIACKIQKNGADARNRDFNQAPATVDASLNVSVLLYMNGTTDYVEPFGLIGAGPTGISFGATTTSFSGFLARAA